MITTNKNLPRKCWRKFTALLALSAVLAVCVKAYSQETAPAQKVDTQVRPLEPGFRTDIGVQLAFGFNHCVGGGSGVADCNGTENAWDFSFGVQGGIIVRPWRRVSLGLDVGYQRIKYHQTTDNKWNDFTIGPVGRYHHPIKLDKFTLEPSLGLQVGWVEGIYNQEKDQGDRLGYNHRHTGPFLAIPLQVDFFFLPRIAVGLEFRVLRTFYTEVCWESGTGTICRGTKDDDLVVINEDKDPTQEREVKYPSDDGTMDYPWKLFWGIHALYYF